MRAPKRKPVARTPPPAPPPAPAATGEQRMLPGAPRFLRLKGDGAQDSSDMPPSETDTWWAPAFVITGEPPMGVPIGEGELRERC